MEAERMENHRLQMERLCTYMTTGKYWKGASDTEKKRTRSASKTHILENGVLFYVDANGIKTEVITSLEKVKEIVSHYHGSREVGMHSGIAATVQKIASIYRWGSIRRDVTHYIKRCPVCQKHEVIKTQAPAMIPIKVKEPLELVQVDLIGPLKRTKAGNRYILTMIDHFTKFVELFQLPSKHPEGVCRKIRSFIRRYGIPRRLQSDRGGEFVNKWNDQLCSTMNIKRCISSAYHPQTNGLVERMNRTVKTRLSKIVEHYKCDWDEVLKDVAVSIRCQKQASTKYSPFFLMFGRKPRLPTEVEEAYKDQGIELIPSGDQEQEDKEPTLDTVSADPEEESENEEYIPTVFKTKLPLQSASDKDREDHSSGMEELMSTIFANVIDNQEKANEKQKKLYAQPTSKGVKTFQLQAGDLVLRQNIRNKRRYGGTLDNLWNGPYRIVDIDSNQRVQLAMEGNDGRMLPARVPYDQLKPFLEDNTVKGVANVTSHTDMKDAVQEVAQAVENSAFVTSPHLGVGQDGIVSTNVDDNDVAEMKPIKQHTVCCTKNEKKRTQKKAACNNINGDFVSETRQKKEKVEKTMDRDDVVFAGMFGPKRRNTEPLPVVPAQRQDTHSFNEMKLVLDQKKELSDLHIDHFSAILKDQFPLIDGLQKVAVFESEECQRVGTPVGKFVQILHVGNHWVTVSNIHCSLPGEVMVYDSHFETIRSEHKAKFLKQLGWLLYTDASHMLIKLVNVQKQQGSITCGLFALAYAHALCAGLRPEQLSFYEEYMWVHLSSCLSTGKLTPFPVLPWQRDTNGKELHRQIQEEVLCICRQPNYPKLPMITCDICKKWYHCQCMKLPDGAKLPKTFECIICRPK